MLDHLVSSDSSTTATGFAMEGVLVTLLHGSEILNPALNSFLCLAPSLHLSIPHTGLFSPSNLPLAISQWCQD